VMAAILGVSNAGCDHLFVGTGRPPEFLPCDAAELARSRYTRSVDDAVTRIAGDLCENEEMLEMFQEEARSWVDRVQASTVRELGAKYPRYARYVAAVCDKEVAT
jgi:hypothetical protein